jgi:hypothetical protein
VNRDKFWLVWNPKGRNPLHRHDSYDAALAESKRLAEQHADESFYVLVALSVSQRIQPVTVTELDGDPEIPF